MTLFYGTADKPGQRWVVTTPENASELQQVGKAEKGRFIGKVWQALRLLEIALAELDVDGWELVSSSFSGIYGLYGIANLRRSASSEHHSSPNT